MRLRTIGVTAALMMGLATAAFAQSENPATAPRLSAMLDNAMAQAATATGSEDHKLGLGVRLGGYGFGAGVSLRAFFAGPLGIQAEVSHYGVGVGFTEVQGAVVYRLKDIKGDFPIILTPYVGGGITHVSYAGFGDTGGIGMGGIEAFFSQMPRVGVSVQIGFRPSISGYAFGGAGATFAGHWYIS